MGHAAIHLFGASAMQEATVTMRISWPVIVLFAVSLLCCMLSSSVFLLMMAEVNAKLPPERQISYFFGYPGLLGKVNALHRGFYPHSQKVHLLRLLIGVALTSFILSAWLSGFFKGAFSKVLMKG